MPTPRRPYEHHSTVNTDAAEALWPQIRGWLEEFGSYGKDEMEFCRKSFVDRLKHVSNGDGYYLAKIFDDWEPNDSFLDIMREFQNQKNLIHDRKIRLWVKDNNIKPKLELGTTVKYLSGSTYRPVSFEGKIVEIEEQMGRYRIGVVLCPGEVSYMISYEEIEKQNGYPESTSEA